MASLNSPIEPVRVYVDINILYKMCILHARVGVSDERIPEGFENFYEFSTSNREGQPFQFVVAGAVETMVRYNIRLGDKFRPLRNNIEHFFLFLEESGWELTAEQVFSKREIEKIQINDREDAIRILEAQSLQTPILVTLDKNLQKTRDKTETNFISPLPLNPDQLMATNFYAFASLLAQNQGDIDKTLQFLTTGDFIDTLTYGSLLAEPYNLSDTFLKGIRKIFGEQAHDPLLGQTFYFLTVHDKPVTKKDIAQRFGLDLTDWSASDRINLTLDTLERQGFLSPFKSHLQGKEILFTLSIQPPTTDPARPFRYFTTSQPSGKTEVQGSSSSASKAGH